MPHIIAVECNVLQAMYKKVQRDTIQCNTTLCNLLLQCYQMLHMIEVDWRTVQSCVQLSSRDGSRPISDFETKRIYLSSVLNLCQTLAVKIFFYLEYYLKSGITNPPATFFLYSV